MDYKYTHVKFDLFRVKEKTNQMLVNMGCDKNQKNGMENNDKSEKN